MSLFGFKLDKSLSPKYKIFLALPQQQRFSLQIKHKHEPNTQNKRLLYIKKHFIYFRKILLFKTYYQLHSSHFATSKKNENETKPIGRVLLIYENHKINRSC